MPGLSPQETVHEVHAAISRGDHSAVMACFEEDAVFLPPGGDGEARGTEAVADAMAEFLDMKPKLHAELTRSVMAAEVALVVVKWTLEAPSADGSSVVATGRTADVLRRGSDARWRYVIDNPNGVN